MHLVTCTYMIKALMHRTRYTSIADLVGLRVVVSFRSVDNYHFRAGIMEADDCQVTTVFTVNRLSTIGTRQTEYHEALSSSANDEVKCDCTFADDGNAL